MKRIAFNILFLFVVFADIANAGTLYNYPYLYKGIRSLGMGGAFTAVGKDAEALFYNPAGLYDMGLKIAILNPHVAVKNYAIGVIGQGMVDARLHNPLSSQGAVEVSAGYEYGPVAGFSIKPPLAGLRIGAGAKYISNSWYEKQITIADIASQKIEPTKDMVSKSDFSLDIGLLYDINIPAIEFLKPKAGFSIIDITDLDFQSSGKGRKIPMRANLGISINPSIPILADTTIAFDYQDIAGAYNQDKSIGKRIHIGGEVGFLSRRILVRAGLNQGYPSLGAELNIAIFKLGYVYYTEEMGAYAGQDKDTRQIVQLSLGW